MIRRYRMLIAAGIFIVLGFILLAAVSATTLVRMDLPSLANSAELIIRARCVSSKSLWESGAIWTFDEFEVLETFKGSPARIVRVRLAGGRISHKEEKVEGVPRFFPGEEVVLFVEKTSAGDYGVTSWAQGTFRVHRLPGDEARITQDTSHFAVFDVRTHQFVPAGIRNLPMTEFRQQIAVALKTPAHGRRPQ